jgi:hypothetical protein
MEQQRSRPRINVSTVEEEVDVMVVVASEGDHVPIGPLLLSPSLVIPSSAVIASDDMLQHNPTHPRKTRRTTEARL